MLSSKIWLSLDSKMQSNSKYYDYHVRHVEVARDYAILLNKKLGKPCDEYNVGVAASLHDIMKDSGLIPEMDGEIYVDGLMIPQNTPKYLKDNRDILKLFGVEDYYNANIMRHAFAAVVFLYKEMGFRDEDILYPILFHSCPVIDVYKKLPEKIRYAIDIMQLADKLSSNYIALTYTHHIIRCDLDKMVFGEDGKEFNYTYGLLCARLMAHDGETEECSVEALEYYISRAKNIYPMIPSNIDADYLGEWKVQPERISMVL